MTTTPKVVTSFMDNLLAYPKIQNFLIFFLKVDNDDGDDDDKFGSYADLQAWIDRNLHHYATALSSDECMEMTACQLGIAAANIPRKELLFG